MVSDPPEENINMNLEELFESNPEAKEAFEQAIEQQATTKAQEATKGLLNKRDELLAEKKALKSEFEDFKSKFDMDEYEAAQAAKRELEEANMSMEQRAAKREQELLDKFKDRETEIFKKNEDAITSLNNEVALKDKSLRRILVENELSRAINAADGVSELLIPVLRDNIQVVEENGEYVARVFDGDTPRVGDSKGNYMTIDQLIAETKANPVFGGAFKSSGATGGGAAGDSGGSSSGSGGAKTRADMTFKERAAYITEHGQEKYLALPAK